MINLLMLVLLFSSMVPPSTTYIRTSISLFLLALFFPLRVAVFSIEPGECFKPELPPDAIIPMAGFPSLHVLTLGSVEERKVPVNVFGTPSRYY